MSDFSITIFHVFTSKRLKFYVEVEVQRVVIQKNRKLVLKMHTFRVLNARVRSARPHSRFTFEVFMQNVSAALSSCARHFSYDFLFFCIVLREYSL